LVMNSHLGFYLERLQYIELKRHFLIFFVGVFFSRALPPYTHVVVGAQREEKLTFKQLLHARRG